MKEIDNLIITKSYSGGASVASYISAKNKLLYFLGNKYFRIIIRK